ncbi:tubulin binding cofactor C-domain-containing protein [Boeremia exigua]|uniref:tubulin binding cofactor C-domain-containing protein n=1 Tax=Boeremia exigua TaxID=749465 RepID=UPI001E8EB217|nr:tubulin binding cofactor C-domain-containing protein [Boeremia exigua]KAH6637729.1 tubulin binding cofactor C-domain-containing protein [Boeremia exigua]
MQEASQTQTEADSKDRFFRYFRHEVTALQEQMERLNSIATGGGERNDAVDHCLAGIDRLSHEVKDASSYIPAYDQRTYSEAIKALSEKLQSIRQTFNPPKKFAFKTRKNASAISISDAAELAASQRARAPIISTSTSTPTSSFAPTPLDRLSPGERKEQEAALHSTTAADPPNPQTLTISNLSGKTIRVPAPGPDGPPSSATLANLTACTIDMRALSTPLHALYLRSLAGCTIITPPVSGATHITGVTDSRLYVATRQFRMHAASGVDVYLACGSRPVVEGCGGVRFAPLVGTGLEHEGENMWDQVDDFGWLKAEKSPNWGVLGEGERELPPKIEEE